MAIRVNGGIVNQQTLTGGMRFFKIVGPFEWAVSDGSVNIDVYVAGGTADPPAKSYFVVGNGRPVPNSAAEKALEVVTRQSDIIVIGFVPGVDGDSTQMDIAVSASAFGWGSDAPDYQAEPADADEEQLPTTPTEAAFQLQAAIRALPDADVWVSTGAPAVDQNAVTPVTATVSFAAVTVTEVSFALADLTYYTLA